MRGEHKRELSTINDKTLMYFFDDEKNCSAIMGGALPVILIFFSESNRHGLYA